MLLVRILFKCYAAADFSAVCMAAFCAAARFSVSAFLVEWLAAEACSSLSFCTISCVAALLSSISSIRNTCSCSSGAVTAVLAAVYCLGLLFFLALP